MKTPEIDTDLIPAIHPQSIAAAATVESAAIDTKGFDGFNLNTGMGAGDSALAFTMTECETDDGTFTPVLDDEDTPVAVSVDFAADEDNTARRGFFRTDRRKRYIKVQAGATGGTSSFANAAIQPVLARDSRFITLAFDYLV